MESAAKWLVWWLTNGCEEQAKLDAAKAKRQAKKRPASVAKRPASVAKRPAASLDTEAPPALPQDEVVAVPPESDQDDVADLFDDPFDEATGKCVGYVLAKMEDEDEKGKEKIERTDRR